jgi:LmbE family N-acetylglucosaminyl deacetylase
MSEVLRQTGIPELTIHPNGRKEYRTILDEQKLETHQTAVFLGAHPDDDALANGVDLLLTQAGIAVIYATLTDGGGRSIKGFSREELIEQRLKENRQAIARKEGVLDINYGYQDGNLSNQQLDAVSSVEELLDEHKPVLIITLQNSDKHIDHATAYAVAEKTAGGLIAIYQADTVNRKDRNNQIVIPTHYFPLTEEEKRIRDEAYRDSVSQTTKLSRNDKRNVRRVKSLSQRRGKEIGRQYAGTLTLADFSLGDPITKILGREKVIFRNN